MRILPSGPESFGITARLFAGGPILAVQRVNVISISDATQNDLTSVTTSTVVGYKLCKTPLTVVNLPPGGRIEISIFRGGVMFANGGTVKTIYASDVSNGRVNLEFLVLFGLTGGYCHSLTVFDRYGNLLSGV
jgi:hypothetical protein